MRIAVCTPHYGPLRPGYVESLSALMALTAGTPVNYNGTKMLPRIRLFLEESGPVDYKRNRLVRRAREWGADYIQWIDNDHIFPADATLRLAMRDLPIVGCNYAQRLGPPVPTAIDGDNERIGPNPQGQVEEVASVGFGFCLMKAEVFDVVPKPWFSTNLSIDGEVLQSDDVHFGNQARNSGIPIFLDPGIEIGHIAETVISLSPEAVPAPTQ
ncbi:MAG: hypothetical protein ACJ8ER_10385 [Allosphingosinicella sp.]